MKKRIAIVIPAFNEEVQIKTVLANLPRSADFAIVIDDGSTDRTAETVRLFARHNRRIYLLRHRVNQGVGAAIVTGYRECLRRGADIAVVMAGDGQMAPSDFHRLVKPLLRNECDFSKGQRISDKKQRLRIPLIRLLGIRILSCLTGAAAGIPGLKDSQCGYTAIHTRMLEKINFESLYPSYGYPNDLLLRLGAVRARIREVPVLALYNIGERPKLRPLKVIFPIAAILIKAAWARMAGGGGRIERPGGVFNPAVLHSVHND